MDLEQIIKQKREKLSKHYPVKSSGLDLQVKEVDLSKRIVQFVANTYYYFDSDQDIIIEGASLKSINDRGPNSKAVAKIKHQADHVMSVKYAVGKPLLIEERKTSGLVELYYESKIPKTTEGDDHLIKYQEEIYDNHSIGFRYLQLALACKECEDEDKMNRWDEFYPMIINKEDVDQYGYFWVVKEIDLFEASTVVFGANSLTGVEGFKSSNKETHLLELNKRMDLLQKQLKHGTVSDESMYDFEIQIRQIKQIMSDIVNEKPGIKDTLPKPPKVSTSKKINYDYLINNLK